MTLGEYRVGIDFNPSNDDRVGQIKRKAADLIDYLQAQRPPLPKVANDLGGDSVPDPQRQLLNETYRLIALAQTHIEDAAMWGVKAVTKQPPK